ncbi:protoheme IX farnesyltransferase [Priestia filamentosa]|uniref:heme o synthase n=1 Tax=Priestia filamentosa TaxID=1402861 RepID=UPI001FB54D1A|nr:heme o synthase [Priestia filamentosa]UOE60408.1 protoheme IX farnesyltransferase [Priestia filamentosa]
MIAREENLVTTEQRTSWTILKQTVKTGIIKSNLITMLAGLTLALSTYNLTLIDKLPELLFALIGSIFVMGAAGALNNLYDRDIDSLMKRTQDRPTVTGEIKTSTVLWLGISLAVLGLIALTLATPMAALFGFLGLFFYLVPYTMWSKRRTIYNTEIGSISGATPPLIGWAAISQDVTNPAIIGLFVITLIWQMPHFYAIAIRKHDDYKAANVPMLPVVKGFKRTYVQTNVYLVVLIATSFLFLPLSLGLTIVSLILGLLWLGLSLFGYKKMNGEKWATSMFIFSLVHMTLLFSTVIVYSLIGMFV